MRAWITLIALAAALSAGLAGAGEADRYGLDLVGKDIAKGLPTFYSAFPADYPDGVCRPARPTSYWHRWYRQRPSLAAAGQGAGLVQVERTVWDFERDADLQALAGASRRIYTGTKLALAKAHATRGKRSLSVSLSGPRPAGPRAVRLPVIGRGTDLTGWLDNWRWIRLDVFNPAGRDVVVAVNRHRHWARLGVGPSFVLAAGANTLAVKTAELDGYAYSRGPTGAAATLELCFLDAPDDAVFHVDNVRLAQEAGKVLSGPGRLFDFGPADKPDPAVGADDMDVLPGWRGASAKSAYTKQRGFGWTDAAGVAAAQTYHRFTTGLLCDYVTVRDPAGRFVVDLPNGRYGVWVLGHADLAAMRLNVQGRDLPPDAPAPKPARSARPPGYFFGYDQDRIRGDSVWCRWSLPKAFAQRRAVVEVTDGKLALQFPDAARRRPAAVTALAVYPLAAKAEAEREIAHLVSVTLAEAVEASHGWIQPAYMARPIGWPAPKKADPAAAFGGIHEEFVHPETAPGRIRDLAVTAAERKRGFVLFARPFTEPVYFDTVPTRRQAAALAGGIEVAGCRGQFLPVSVGVWPLAEIASATLTAGPLAGPGKAAIPAAAFDVRLERYDERWCDFNHENDTPYWIVPVWQVHRGAALDPGLARRFVADLRIPAGAAPGRYAGKLTFAAAGRDKVEIDLAVEVLPFALVGADRYFALPAAVEPIYLAYGFNTLLSSPAEAKAKGLRGCFVVGGRQPAQDLPKLDTPAMRRAVADGREGKGPRVFFTSTWSGGHQYLKPDARSVAALRAKLPGLEVLGWTAPWLWLTNFKHAGQAPRRLILSAETLKSASGKEAWLADAVQPTKDLAGRFTTGLYLWRSGIAGRLSFANGWSATLLSRRGHAGGYPADVGWTIGWRHNQPMTGSSTWAFLLAEPAGRWAVARDLVNLREGITDYRYLRTLEKAAPGDGRARAFLDGLRKEFPDDLTRCFGGWAAWDGGGENWYARPGSPLSVRRLDEIRARAAELLKAPSKDAKPG